MKSRKFTDYTYLEIKSLIDAGCFGNLADWMYRNSRVRTCRWTSTPGLRKPLPWRLQSTRTLSWRPCSGPSGLPFGPTPEHRGFGSGYVNIPHSVHQACVYRVLESLRSRALAASLSGEAAANIDCRRRWIGSMRNSALDV